MTISYLDDLIQGTDEWLQARCGILTASQMHRLLTPKMRKKCKSDAVRSLQYELLAQRITGHVEPSYVSDAMLLGTTDEEDAIALYSEKIAPVERMGLILNDGFGFTLGYSPDALVGDNGLVEVKSHCHRIQVKAILAGKHAADEHMMQLQAGLLVSERKWIDFVSYSPGLPLHVVRVMPDIGLMLRMEEAAREFEEEMECLLAEFEFATRGMIQTELRNIGEIVVC